MVIISPFLFFYFCLRVIASKIVLYERFGSDSSCISALGMSTQINVEECIFFNGKQVTFTYSELDSEVKIETYLSSDCSDVPTVQGNNMDCAYNPTEGVYGKYSYVDAEVVSSNVLYEKVYHSRKCEGPVQYISYIDTPSACLPDTHGNDRRSYRCGTTRRGSELAHYIRFNKTDCEITNDTFIEKEILLEGCDLLSEHTSSQYFCGDVKSEVVQNRLESSKFAALAVCFGMQTIEDEEKCNFETCEFIFEMDYECAYDNKLEAWYNIFCLINDYRFKYDVCNEKEQVLKKTVYKKDFCKDDIIDYYAYEPLIESALSMTTTLYCGLQNTTRRSTDISLQGYYDDECKIMSDRLLHFPVRNDCRYATVDLRPVPGIEGIIEIGIDQGCFGGGLVGMAANMFGCGAGFMKIFKWQAYKEECKKTDDFIEQYIWNDVLPFVKVLNSDYCRTCGDEFHYNDGVCSNNGECVDNNICQCASTHGGPLCEDTIVVWTIKENLRKYWWSILVFFLIVLMVLMLTTSLLTVWRISTDRKKQVKTAPKSNNEEICLLFTDIQNSTNIYESDPEAMSIAMKLHNDLMRRLIRKHKGYEVKTIGDSFFITFKSPKNTFLFILEVQNELQKLPYPKSLFRVQSCETELCKTGDQIRFQGLRVRMGIHIGFCDVKFFKFRNQYGNYFSILLKKLDYFGNAVNVCARIEGAAPGGRVFMSDAFKKVIETIDIEEPYELQDVGVQALKGISNYQQLWCVYQNERYSDKEIEFTLDENGKKVVQIKGETTNISYKEDMIEEETVAVKDKIEVAAKSEDESSSENESGASIELEEQSEEQPKANICCICLTNASNLLYLPCKHISQCKNCPKQPKCPICRREVESTVQVFLS